MQTVLLEGKLFFILARFVFLWTSFSIKENNIDIYHS